MRRRGGSGWIWAGAAAAAISGLPWMLRTGSDDRSDRFAAKHAQRVYRDYVATINDRNGGRFRPERPHPRP